MVLLVAELWWFGTTHLSRLDGIWLFFIGAVAALCARGRWVDRRRYEKLDADANGRAEI